MDEDYKALLWDLEAAQVDGGAFAFTRDTCRRAAEVIRELLRELEATPLYAEPLGGEGGES